MYKRSVRRAYFGISPHLWPFAAWRMLVAWAAIGIGGAALAAYVAGVDDLNPIGASLVALIYSVWIGFFLLIPATVLTLLDAALMRRPNHRPAKFDARARRFDRQNLASWAGYAGLVGTVFGVAYLFVYLNAFAIDQSYLRLLRDNLLRFAIGGAGAGVVVARIMNAIHDRSPAGSLNDQLRRAAVLWGATVIGFATALLYFADSALERSIIPGALLAVIGAAVIPQLAVTPPMDLSQIPPPQLPSAPSPGSEDPEGGTGGGARGDWRNAPPPELPRNQPTRSNSNSISTPMEVANG